MQKEQIRGVGLNPNTYIHLTEHLAPLCTIMDMPLLLTDEQHNQQALDLYPGLKTLLIDWEDVTPQYLYENFEMFFQSEPWNRKDFYTNFQLLEQTYQKNVRNVHCPHGFSDKVFWLQKCVDEDITLIYGENMLDMFKEFGVIDHLNAYVRSGNYRYAYYLQHQEFYDQLIEQQVWNQFADKTKPTILYAPTCHDLEHTTSFLHAQPLFENLPAEYNLLVKIHPALEETDGPALYRLMGKYDNKGNVVFVKDLPLVYPILARAALYIGDMSSIGYDFLVFNRPMFFLNQIKRDPQRDRQLFLYRCGVTIQPEEYSKIYPFIASHLASDQSDLSKMRSQVYHYTFGENIPFNQLKNSILETYFSQKKLN